MTGLQVINVGAFPNDATGDPLQSAFQKCNSNFAVLNALGTLAQSPSAGWGTPTNAGVLQNFSGSAATTAQCGEALAQIILILQQAGLLAT
jgi:hypothetical protein